MASGSDWIKNETTKRLKAYLASKNTVAQPQRLQAVEFITFTKPDKSEGKTKSGFIVKTIPKGSIEREGWGFRVNNTNTYIVTRQKERPKGIDSSENYGYDLVRDYSNQYYILKVSPQKIVSAAAIDGYTIANLTVPERSLWSYTYAFFSRDGNSLVIIYAFQDHTANNDYGYRFKWGWAKNWRISSSNAFSYQSNPHYQATFDSTTLPIVSAPPKPNLPTFPNCAEDTDVYFTNNAQSSRSDLSFDFIVYDDVNGSPALDIVGNWATQKTYSIYFRNSGGGFGATTYTYGAMTLDSGSGNYYRIVTQTPADPITHIDKHYWVNGTSLSFPVPPNSDFNFLSPSDNWNPVDVMNIPSAITGGAFLGFWPTYVYYPGRDTVQGSTVPTYLHGSYWPSTFFGVSELSPNAPDMATDLNSLAWRTGLFTEDTPALKFVTGYITNLNRNYYMTSSINGATPTSLLCKSSTIRWNSSSTSFNPGSGVRTAYVIVPTYDSVQTMIVFGSGLGSDNTKSPYAIGSGLGAMGTGTYRGHNYYQGGYLGDFYLNSVKGMATAFRKSITNSSNYIIASAKSDVDAAAALDYFSSNHEYCYWAIDQSNIPGFVGYFNTTPTQSVTDHTKAIARVTNEIALLEDMYGGPVTPSPPNVTAPFQAPYPTDWESLYTSKATASQHFSTIKFYSNIHGFLQKQQKWEWSDVLNIAQSVKSRDLASFDPSSYRFHDFFLK